MIRQPIVAGRFYAASAGACARQVRECLPVDAPLPNHFSPCGGLVPHAGWAFSGKISGRVFRALADTPPPDTIILLGAVHAVRGRRAALFDRGAWTTPLGDVAVDDQLAEVLLSASAMIQRDCQAHRTEHSLEVQIPFLQTVFPQARVLPLMVPPSDLAAPLGAIVGRALLKVESRVLLLGTSDLTHYGPNYGLTTHGIGAGGLDWAKNHNDRRMIQRILDLDAEGIVSEAAAHRNACGAGAIAATIAACRELGADRALLLDHMLSSEVLPPGPAEQATDAVGYAGVIFGK